MEPLCDRLVLFYSESMLHRYGISIPLSLVVCVCVSGCIDGWVGAGVCACVMVVVVVGGGGGGWFLVFPAGPPHFRARV